MPLQPGDRVGPYEILSLIGAGGMGEVYRARDPRLDRDIALKIAREAARFQFEAKAIAALSHPNIVNVYDFGSDGDVLYIAMELIDGVPLREKIAQPMPWTAVATLGASIADALQCAHEKGIVHRDLKPENVVITNSGSVKVLDFGLARSTASAPEGSTVTRTGTVVGTSGYMSPEQVRGETVGPQSDIFSLGCVLYELLTGRHPFRRGSHAETTAAMLRDESPELPKSVPHDIARIVRHCLEREPARRFRSAADVAFALRNASQSTRPRFSKARLALLVAAIVAVIIFGRRFEKTETTPILSVAVMPFANNTNNPELTYLSDGLTEAVINNLVPVAGFKVLSRNSVFSYKPSTSDPRVIGKDLDVDAIVSGRLAARDRSIVISVELTDARDGRQIWGERYERPFTAIAALEHELSSEVSERLRMRLTPADRTRINRASSVRPEAYQLYLQGRYEWNKRSPEGLRKGIEFFRRSTDIDPTYAPAHAGIADSYVLLGGVYDVMRPRDAMPMARKAALEAIALDPQLAEPHASLGIIEHEFEWNWPRAEESFRRAIQLNDNSVSAHQWYGQALVYRGRIDEGLRELLRAEQLDPLSLVTKSDVAQAYWIARRYDTAIERARNLIEIEPNFWLGHLFLGLAQLSKGDSKGAVPSLERAAQLGGSPVAVGSLGYAYARSGRREDALRLLSQLREKQQTQYIAPAAFMMIHLGLGDHDRAFEQIERAIEERGSLLAVINSAPIAEELRKDARYAEVARKVGLP